MFFKNAVLTKMLLEDLHKRKSTIKRFYFLFLSEISFWLSSSKVIPRVSGIIR